MIQTALETFSVLTWILIFISWSLFHVHGFNSESVLTLVSFAIGPWVSCCLSGKSPVSSCVFVQIKAYKIQTASLGCCLQLLKLPWAAGARVPIKFGSPIDSLMKHLGNSSYWHENMGMFSDTVWSLGHSLIEGWFSVPAASICSAICVCVFFNCHMFSSLF